MSKASLVVLQIGIYAVGLAMPAIAYYRAQDFAPTYFALYAGGLWLVGSGTMFVDRQRRSRSAMRSTTAKSSGEVGTSIRSSVTPRPPTGRGREPE